MRSESAPPRSRSAATSASSGGPPAPPVCEPFPGSRARVPHPTTADSTRPARAHAFDRRVRMMHEGYVRPPPETSDVRVRLICDFPVLQELTSPLRLLPGSGPIGRLSAIDTNGAIVRARAVAAGLGRGAGAGRLPVLAARPVS